MSLPIRKCLDHRGPLSICTTDAVYFITIAAEKRGTTTLTDKADVILSAARFYQSAGKWFLYLFLIMPDHIHMLVHVPPVGCAVRSAEDVRPYRSGTDYTVVGGDVSAPRGLAKTIGDFKSYLTKAHGLAFQSNFFDTRIRDREHFAEKWNYICRNPVARGLTATAREWPHSVAFDPATGQERPHRSARSANPECPPYHVDAMVGGDVSAPRDHNAARPESAPYLVLRNKGT